jgi:hypothetical protein
MASGAGLPVLAVAATAAHCGHPLQPVADDGVAVAVEQTTEGRRLDRRKPQRAVGEEEDVGLAYHSPIQTPQVRPSVPRTCFDQPPGAELRRYRARKRSNDHQCAATRGMLVRKFEAVRPGDVAADTAL